MKYKLFILVLFSLSAKAQYTFKIKKEDNRFLFFQKGIKNDTLLKGKTDVFFVRFPDSLQHQMIIYIENGQFIKTKNDSLFQLLPIQGMKYSLSKPDSSFIPLVEGVCSPSKTITINVVNTNTQKRILQNKFIVK